MSNPATIELAKQLVDLSPVRLEHVFYSSDGSSAVEVALKMAFQFWQQRDVPRPQKTKFVALGDAYHGDTVGSVSVGGVERFHAMFQPLLFEVIRLPMPETYRVPSEGTANPLAYHLSLLDEVLNARHEEIAAMVIEPLMQCAAGMIRHPEGYLRGVRELTRKYDVLLIADEIAVGFGRTGKLFACEHETVSPDFLCLGKGITGGYLPMAATLTTDEVWNAFLGSYDQSRQFYHGHTYGGNPLAASVALASLGLFRDEQLLDQLAPKIERLSAHLQQIADHPNVGSIRQQGLIAGIELVRDRATQEPFAWGEKRGMRVCNHAMTEGVWIRPLGNVVVAMPPLTISLEELDRIMVAIQNGINVATQD